LQVLVSFLFALTSEMRMKNREQKIMYVLES
jgi:hypothetical protein